MAKPYPIVKVTLCSHLKGVKAGELSPDLLRVIENRGKLHQQTMLLEVLLERKEY